VAFQFIKRGVQHPGLAWIIRQQPDHAMTAAERCFELENTLERLDAQPLHPPGLRARIRNGKISSLDAGLCSDQEIGDRFHTLRRTDGPGKREQIAVMTFRRKQDG
jgi:hypothetical protein